MNRFDGLQRASLGVINHLDWFLSTVWKMVGTVEVEPQMRANIDNMLTSSSVAVNHLAHMQARLLVGNATFRREGLLDASVLDRAGAQFLRSQPIGGADLFAGKVPEALRVASEDRKDLLFQPHNHLRHRSLPAVCLHVWRLSSDLSKREAFRRQLPIRSRAGVGNPHVPSTTASGGCSLVGVLGSRWIHSRSLFRN